MRSKFLPLVMIAGMTLGGAAFAGTTATTTTAKAPAATMTKVSMATMDTSGTITKISTKHNYVVLSDGFKYHLPSTISAKSFKVGEKVSVTYDMKGKLHEVTAIKAA